MNIIVESKIPFMQGQLEPYATVRYLSPDDITAQAVRDADALFVRTRTRCDAALLEGSRCRFIATATIGTDHIDMPWCASQGITVANATGCNAPAVAQYVFASLGTLGPVEGKTIGIVGVGHVGSIVERWARQLGMRVLVNDPPRQKAEGGQQWSSLDTIARQADIITLHTPLDATTRHLADQAFFESLGRQPVIVNAARGPVVDNVALVEALRRGRVSHAIIDCWEDEPDINHRLLELADIATPHIAGYSYEGKVRGSRMALEAFARWQGRPMSFRLPDVAPSARESVTLEDILLSYDPMADTSRLKRSPSCFESLRNDYRLRHEV